MDSLWGRLLYGFLCDSFCKMMMRVEFAREREGASIG
jgi:hypothetical protein